MAESLESQWRRISKNVRSAFYRQSEAGVSRQALRICQRVTEIAASIHWGPGQDPNPGMTGNSRAGVACGVYRDGHLLGYATTGETDMGKPMWHAVKKDEVFRMGTPRYDGGVQENDFAPGEFGANREYDANARAVAFLKRNRPNYKGFSYIIVHGAHYIKYNGFDQVMSNLFAELSMARKVTFHEMRNNRL